MQRPSHMIAAASTTDRRRWLCVVAGILAAAALPRPARAAALSLGGAINKAGRQRMLSQRMAKAYGLVGAGVLTERFQGVLDTSVAVFDRQLVELKVFSPTPEIRAIYGQLTEVWQQYKEMLVGHDPERKHAARIAALSDEVLQLAHAGTVQLEGLSGEPVGRLINVSGRQRMLSQRLGKLFVLAHWGVKGSEPALARAAQEFVAGHQVLETAPETSARIRAELELAAQQWIFFDNALKSRDPVGVALRNVATTSERILETMERVTDMYQQLSA